MLKQKWPVYDEVTIVIQVNGKLRDQFQVSADLAKNKVELEKIALEQIQGRLDGKAVRKVIVVPGRLVNVVV